MLNAIEEGRARGNGQMAGGLYTGEDAEDVANFVAKAVGATEPPSRVGRLSDRRPAADATPQKCISARCTVAFGSRRSRC